MCTQQHTRAAEVPKYTEPTNQSPKLTKFYAQGHKQYGTSNKVTLKLYFSATVYSSITNIQQH
jgi:hypothetical protein